MGFGFFRILLECYRMPRKPPVVPPETQQSLLKAIQEAEAPLKLAQLAKCIPKLTGPHVKQLLAEDVAAGHIFNWGSDKTPIYWLRDREAEARDRLLKFAAEEPLTKAQLTSRAAKQAPKIGPAIVKPLLEGLLHDRGLCLAPKTKRVMHTDAYLENEIAHLLKDNRAGTKLIVTRIERHGRIAFPFGLFQKARIAQHVTQGKMRHRIFRMPFHQCFRVVVGLAHLTFFHAVRDEQAGGVTIVRI